MYIFHELHCDDLLLEKQQDPQIYAQAKALVEAICQVAEGRGMRLALRFRWAFPEAALAIDGADNPLVQWEERGHEIGTHAHGRRIRRAKEAIDAAGVKENVAVVPGLIRRSRREAARVIAATRGMGFTYCTDQPQHGCFPYSGLTPWRPAPDLSGPGEGELVFLDVSVNPFDWGLLQVTPKGIAQAEGLKEENFQRLLALLDRHLGAPRPHPVTYFGYPFHEHQHAMAIDDLRPNTRSLEAWDSFLGALPGREVEEACPREIYRHWLEIESPGKERRYTVRFQEKNELVLNMEDGPRFAFKRLQNGGVRHNASSRAQDSEGR